MISKKSKKESKEDQKQHLKIKIKPEEHPIASCKLEKSFDEIHNLLNELYF